MEIIKMQNKLFESYIKSASRYLTEDDEELEDVVDVDDTENVEDTDADTETGADEEVLELDLANPVCPSCGASLVITDEPIDTEDEDLGLEDDEADAIQLLQGLGYIVYKPTEPAEEDEDETIDDDAAIDDETLDDDVDDDFTEDEDF